VGPRPPRADRCWGDGSWAAMSVFSSRQSRGPGRDARLSRSPLRPAVARPGFVWTVWPTTSVVSVDHLFGQQLPDLVEGALEVGGRLDGERVAGPPNRHVDDRLHLPGAAR